MVLRCLARFKRWSIVDLETVLCFAIRELDCPAWDLLWILPLVVGESSCVEGILTEMYIYSIAHSLN